MRRLYRPLGLIKAVESLCRKCLAAGGLDAGQRAPKCCNGIAVIDLDDDELAEDVINA